jgi:nuclear pore complex protein Nup98-Nup96
MGPSVAPSRHRKRARLSLLSKEKLIPFMCSKPRTSPSTVHITHVPIVSSPTAAESLTGKLLQHHLTHSPIALDAYGVPFATPSPALRFSSLASLFPQTDHAHHASLFRLGHALFDDMDLKLPKEDNVAASASTLHRSVSNIRRKAAVSAWLEDAVSPAVQANLASAAPFIGKTKKDDDGEKPAKEAFTLLTGNRSSDACSALLAGGCPRLATLVAQVPGANAEFRKDVRDQIDLWKAQRVYDHIGPGIRRLYTLIAGRWGAEEEGRIFAGLDWMRAYGLHLWYALPGEASLSDVFEAYDQFWREGERSAPALPYASHPPSVWKAGKERELDAHLSLLRLHADPGYSLSLALHPLAYSSSPLDYAMPWHIYVLLSRCMRVRDLADRRRAMVADGSEKRAEGHSPSADLLAGAYAWQLEGMGLVQEATFVLLHLEESLG